MKKPVSTRVKVFAAIMVLVVAAGMLFFWGVDEPSYKGRSLSEWLETTYYYKDGELKGSPDEDFRVAMQAMGTNAIPHLVKKLKKRNYPLAQRLIDRAGDVRDPNLHRFGIMTPYLERRRAVHGLQELGERITSAIPQILQCSPSGELVQALDKVGPTGLPVLLRAMEEGNEDVKFTGLFALQSEGFDRDMAVKTWIRYTTNDTPRVRWAATTLLWAAPARHRDRVNEALKRLEMDPDEKVAAMTKLTSQRISSSRGDFEGILVPP